MKRLIAILVALTLCLSLTIFASAEDDDFVIENGVLVQYNGIGCDVVIPDSVTVIGAYAFFDCETLTSITIPDSVITIGDSAFSACTSLTEVIIPESVTSIGPQAFYGCDNLLYVFIPVSVTRIELDAFSACNNIDVVAYEGSKEQWYEMEYNDFTNQSFPPTIQYVATSDDNITDDSLHESDLGFIIKNGTLLQYTGSNTSIVIPNSVTKISDGAFAGCSNLSTVYIPTSVTRIGDQAFEGCTKLHSITVPASVVRIGDNVFGDCSALSTFNYIGNEKQWNKIKLGKENEVLTRVFKRLDTYIFNEGKTLSYYVTSNSTVEIDSDVVKIGAGVFANNTQLTSITIPNSITSIGDNAFYDCTALTEVFYGGTQEQWNAITLGEGNEALTRATINFTSLADGERNEVLTSESGNSISQEGISAKTVMNTAIPIVIIVAVFVAVIVLVLVGKKKKSAKPEIHINAPRGAATTTRCGVCGYLGEPNSKFCENCGTPIKNHGLCSCGYQNKPGANFCEQCGSKL